jgi:hypothetical protein
MESIELGSFVCGSRASLVVVVGPQIMFKMSTRYADDSSVGVLVGREKVMRTMPLRHGELGCRFSEVYKVP